MPTSAPEKTDPLAAVRAAQILADLASTSRAKAEEVVSQFGVRFERDGNLRRVVLTGPYEVDPTAVRAQTPNADRVAEAAVAILSA